MTVDYNLDRAKAAVQYLVDSPYFAQHVRKIRGTAAKPRSTPFKDDAEVLNELVVIGRQSLTAMENLIAVAQHKRDDRNDYQRQYMAAKRQRDSKVLLLQSLLEGSKLPHDYRVRVLQKQYLIWHKERDAFMAQLGDVSFEARNAKLKEFWATKEGELDALIEEAKTTAPITRTRKRVVVVSKSPTTPFGESLASALRKR